MKYLILSVLVFILFIGSVYYINVNDYEHFQGKPPINYVDILPSSPSDLQKLNVNNDKFNVPEVKRYFPNFIKKEILQKRGAIPIEVEVVDKNAMVSVAWKVADELNTLNTTQRNLLLGLQDSLDKSRKMLELTKEKCKI